MNAYADLVKLKDDLGIIGTSDDTRLLALLNAASKAINNYCHRHFYVKTATKYFDGKVPLFIDDLLSITTLKTDEDGDATFENTLATTDYHLYPLNTFPKTFIKLSGNSNYGGFGYFKKGCEIIGSWGYGDETDATPYADSGDEVEDVGGISTSDTSITVTDADNFSPGQTILIESEQCYISAYDTSAETLTVIRAVNGTTAATHAKDTTIYIYDYPADILQVCLMVAGRLFQTRGKAMKSEKLGDYSYTITDNELMPAEKAFLTPYRKVKV